jgi:hypothetical protein
MVWPLSVLVPHRLHRNSPLFRCQSTLNSTQTISLPIELSHSTRALFRTVHETNPVPIPSLISLASPYRLLNSVNNVLTWDIGGTTRGRKHLSLHCRLNLSRDLLLRTLPRRVEVSRARRQLRADLHQFPRSIHFRIESISPKRCLHEECLSVNF